MGGNNERLVGKALKGHRKSVYIATRKVRAGGQGQTYGHVDLRIFCPLFPRARIRLARASGISCETGIEVNEGAGVGNQAFH